MSPSLKHIRKRRSAALYVAAAQCICYRASSVALIYGWGAFKLLLSRKNKLENKKTTRAHTLPRRLNFIPKLRLPPLLTTLLACGGAPAFNVAGALKILFGHRYRTTADVTHAVNCRQFHHCGSIKTYDDIIKNTT